MRRLTVFILCLVLSASVMAADNAQKSADNAMTRFQRDLVNLLVLRSEAQPLLGAALLARTLPDPPDYLSYHALLQRAAKAPDAGLAITWAQLVDCDRDTMTCPNRDALAELKKQAPDNAATWLMVLGRAHHDLDDDVARQALVKAANASTYDDYQGTTLKALATAVTTLPPPDALYDDEEDAANSAAGTRALLVFGLGSLQPMPGFHAAARLCKPDDIDDERRATCLKLAKTLVWAGAPLARSLGLHLQETLSADPAIRQQAKAARRDLTWQVRNFGKLTLATQRDAELARHMLQLARNGGTRMSLILAALRNAQIPVEAPAGWQPGEDADDHA